MADFTLATLRTAVRRRADMEDDGLFISDAELAEYINLAIAEWHDLIVEVQGEDIFLTSTTIAGTGTDRYALPAAFQYLRGVEQVVGTDRFPLRSHTWQRRAKRAGDVGTGEGAYTYRLEGAAAVADAEGYTAYIRFSPALASGDSVTVWYIPRAPSLSADADNWSTLGGWGEYAIVRAAMKCLEKEESDTSSLEHERQILERRIRSMAAVRDVTEPDQVADVYADGWQDR